MQGHDKQTNTTTTTTTHQSISGSYTSHWQNTNLNDSDFIPYKPYLLYTLFIMNSVGEQGYAAVDNLHNETEITGLVGIR